MDKLEPIDRQAVEHVLSDHVMIIDDIHRRQRLLYGVGGICVAAATVLTPLTLVFLDFKPLQIVLSAVAVMLCGLSLLRAIAQTQSARQRSRFENYCEEAAVEAHSIVESTRLVRHRWGFFTSLWDGLDTDTQAHTRQEDHPQIETPQHLETDTEPTDVDSR